MKLLKSISAVISAIVLSSMLITTAQAQDQVKLRVLSWYGNQPQITDLERPFWKRVSSDPSAGVNAQFRTIDELGLKGFESLRTLQSGAFDVVSFQISFVGAEAPVLMGADLPGLAFDFDELKRIADSYRSTMEKNLDTKYDAKLLMAWPFPFQILYCKDNVNSLNSLQGKKVRVSGSLMAEMVKQLGGAAVTLAGPEVYQGLMQGVVDCAITGSQYGNSNDWFEVSKTLNTTPIGGAGLVLQVARKDAWNKIPKAQREALESRLKSLEADLWKMARESHENGINCNTGVQPCSGKLGKMTVARPSDVDRTKVKKILVENIIPIWIKDCEKTLPNCRNDWNDSVGAAMKMKN